jgi:hypothetical protein
MSLEHHSAAFKPTVLDAYDQKVVAKIRQRAILFARAIEKYVPSGLDQNLALQYVEDATMRAVKGIAEG